MIEWGVIIVVGGFLYFTGLHTVVIGKMQQLILATGLMKPSVEQADKPEARWNKAYPFVLESDSGEIRDVRDLKGKVLFVNFWATWCPPCIAEMPGINRLYEKLQDNPNVVFLMISRDDDFQKAQRFVAKRDFQFPIYRLRSGIPKVLQSQILPTTFIIDPEGHIQLQHKGMADYDNERMEDFLIDLAKY